MKKEETLASFLWFQFSSYHDEKEKNKKKYIVLVRWLIYQ
jgi:hypothetical protein